MLKIGNQEYSSGWAYSTSSTIMPVESFTFGSTAFTKTATYQDTTSFTETSTFLTTDKVTVNAKVGCHYTFDRDNTGAITLNPDMTIQDFSYETPYTGDISNVTFSCGSYSLTWYHSYPGQPQLNTEISFIGSDTKWETITTGSSPFDYNPGFFTESYNNIREIIPIVYTFTHETSLTNVITATFSNDEVKSIQGTCSLISEITNTHTENTTLTSIETQTFESMTCHRHYMSSENTGFITELTTTTVETTYETLTSGTITCAVTFLNSFMPEWGFHTYGTTASTYSSLSYTASWTSTRGIKSTYASVNNSLTVSILSTEGDGLPEHIYQTLRQTVESSTSRWVVNTRFYYAVSTTQSTSISINDSFTTSWWDVVSRTGNADYATKTRTFENVGTKGLLIISAETFTNTYENYVMTNSTTFRFSSQFSTSGGVSVTKTTVKEVLTTSYGTNLASIYERNGLSPFNADNNHMKFSFTNSVLFAVNHPEITKSTTTVMIFNTTETISEIDSTLFNVVSTITEERTASINSVVNNYELISTDIAYIATESLNTYSGDVISTYSVISSSTKNIEETALGIYKGRVCTISATLTGISHIRLGEDSFEGVTFAKGNISCFSSTISDFYYNEYGEYQRLSTDPLGKFFKNNIVSVNDYSISESGYFITNGISTFPDSNRG